ncbi:hypothetical protein GCM10010381_02220 [Streptomyces xantholiticus]|uniref:hypothetical protein n=1 Tax=Streptomyces xantholiticus TaxID=68285 RepID=UPI0019C2A466|nr:hypothetical protein [Streptomyces xantholiticus]GGW23314.1 hypothetical protein GCM10010381_02220 [Streptomyces xantholiticus]
MDELVGGARRRGLQLTGEAGLQQLIKRLLQSALEGESRLIMWSGAESKVRLKVLRYGAGPAS